MSNPLKQTLLFSDGTNAYKLDSIIDYRFNESTGKWDEKLFKKSFVYDENFNDTLVINSIWDKNDQHWKNVTKEITQYNNNKVLSYERHILSKSGQRIDYTYNDKEELTEITESKWLFGDGKWLQIKKQVNSYNSAGVIIADTLYYKFTDSEEWVPVKKTQYSYNAEGDLLVDTIYNKQKGSDVWQLFGKTEYAYNNGYIELLTSSNWSVDSKQFIPYLKKQTLYDYDEWHVYGTNEYEWDKASKDWKITKAKSYGFDDENHVNSCTNKTWDFDTTTVQEVFNFDYTIDNSNLRLPTILDANERVAFHHKIISKQALKYNHTISEMEKFRETAYYYSVEEVFTGIDDIDQDVVSVYPNPASECIIVKFSNTYKQTSFALYDINGKEILSKTLRNKEKIDIDRLKKGIYFYSIHIGQSKVTGKLIKD
ncbi:T9SS type A sorting domain-containing protein [Limibacter armeniacum]|uniref:T9SS type A sorting domain-containing protein n=1 Tax=Limibacter armeniacum TaxID=466084 RepID=UPI002FE53E1F